MIAISLMKVEKKEQHSHARALLRECLKPAGIALPAEEELGRGDMGKPFLIDRPDVRFNVSHADGIAACCVSSRECGIDCENVRAFRPNVMKRAFSEAERRLVESAPESRRDLLFFRLWTLKEAYVKAIGRGIAYPLDKAEFGFEDGEIVPRPEGSRFRQYILRGGRFVVSVCELAPDFPGIIVQKQQ